MTSENQNRRSFIGNALNSIAILQMPGVDLSRLESLDTKKSRSSAALKIKQINAGVLNIGYVDEGPSNGPVVMLLHGWPYDIHAFAEVIPLLTKQGLRVIAPFLRGYGSTFFLNAATKRNGQQSVFAVDAIALLDSLNIQKAIFAGFDWGARTACIIAARWPERTIALVSVSGYLIGNQDAGRKPLMPAAELQWWYQFYFSTERGKVGYEQNLDEFARLIWRSASPGWKFTDEEFKETANHLHNPDHVSIVIHNYRWRLGIETGEKTYDDIESFLAAGPTISAPTITIEGDTNGAPHPKPEDYKKRFSGKYKHLTFSNTGHNPPQESPELFANAVIEVSKL